MLISFLLVWYASFWVCLALVVREGELTVGGLTAAIVFSFPPLAVIACISAACLYIMDHSEKVIWKRPPLGEKQP